MNDSIHNIGKMMIVLGLIITAAGGLFMLSSRVSWLGRLPGDILVQKKNFTFYFPFATSIILSILLSLIFWTLGRR